MPCVACGADSPLSPRGRYPVLFPSFRDLLGVAAPRKRRALLGQKSGVKSRSGRLKGFFLALIGGLMLTAVPAVAGAQAATTTTLAITSAGAPVTTVASGSVVTLTATVMAGATPVTVGQVNFCDATAKYCEEIHLLGTAQLTKAGTAVFKFRPGIGSHSYEAVFVGTNDGAGSTSGAAALTVTGLPPTVTTVAQSGSAGLYTLRATVRGNGGAAPTGTVSFLDASSGDSLLGTATLGTGAVGLQFLNSASPATGVLPMSIAVGDFNGDGIPDLAVANLDSNTVTILLGNGDGTFTAASASPATGSAPESIALGDFNGDGIPDLAVANFGSNTVTILLGNGDGTFTAASASPATGHAPYSIAVGDFNGDGIPDLAVANTGSRTVTILLGNGDGTFTAASASPATGVWPYSIAVGDFNGDGIPDLAVANECGNDSRCGSVGTVTILLGNGNGTFTAASASPAMGYRPESIVAGDFNGDGVPDLAVANRCGNAATCQSYGDGFPAGSVTILLGNGDGTFAAASASPATGSQPSSIVEGDFNGDGIPDLAVANQYDGTVTILQTITQSATATATGITVPVATGTHQVVASYSGDSNYKPSTSGATALTAAQGTPRVSVAASPDPVIYGASATLTATVSGSGLTPTGALMFYNGSRLLGAGTLRSGVAVYRISGLATGLRSITAWYSGDSNYIAATSPAYSLTVNPATPVATLTASAGTVPYGTSVTFTATLAGAGVVPTGTVTFLDGATQLGTGRRNGPGVATYTTSALALGAHSITASYGGDTNYNPVTSLALTERIVPATTTALTVASAGNPVTTIASGNAVSLIATVQSAGAPVTAGTVNFCDATAAHCTDIHLLGTAQLTAAGTAAIKFIPGIGSHSYKAVFVGTNTFGMSASAASALTVTGLYPTATAIAESGTVGNYTLTATVGGIGPLWPTGQVSFLDASNGNALLGTAALGAGSSALNFVTASNPPDGDGATSVAVGDFNGDGILDFAVANFNTNTISVFLGDGTGNFTQTVNSPPTSDNPIFVVAGDFNGDGILDLAVANYGGSSVGILLGDGKGNFTPTASPIVTGNRPDAIAVGDFNGDGKLDLAVTNYADNTVTVLLGNGKGNFTAQAGKPATGWEPQSIATGDFNGDGIADLAVANGCGSDPNCQTDGKGSAGSVTVLLGKGDGSFTAASASPATGIDPYSIMAGDFNGDGKTDLAVANFKGEDVTVLLGNGNGTFTAAATSPATGNGPYSIALGDFNGDGIPDLVTANYDDNTLTVLLGDGKGGFTAMAATPQTGQYPVAVAVGDFNGDGCPDLAVANYYDSAMTVLLTASSAAATATVSGIAPAGAGAHIVAATYGGDGNYGSSASGTIGLSGQAPTTTTLDLTQAGNPATTVNWGSAVSLAATVQAGGVPVTTGTVNFCDATAAHCTDIHRVGTAQLTSAGTAAITLRPAVGSHSYKAVFAGITGGSALSSTSASAVASLTVTGTLPSTTTISQSGTVGNYTLTATVAGAGVASPTGTVSFLDASNGNSLLANALLGAGTAGLSFLNSSNPAAGSEPQSVAVGDFTGDGILDLAVLNFHANTVTVLLGDGTGNFTPTASPIVTGDGPDAIAVGDFNGDGVPDLAVANGSSNNLTVLLGKGDGTFTASASPGAGGPSDSIAVGDFNGDGIPDLAVANFGSNTVTILLGNGDGTFTATAARPTTGRSPQSIAVGDFNGDGILDLAVANAASNNITVLLGNGGGTFTPTATSPVTGGEPESIATGDFNGDGILDLAVAYYDGGVTVLLGKGDGTFTPSGNTSTGPNVRGLAIADFNGDGIPDLAVTNSGNHSVTILLGNGDGTFETKANPSTGNAPIGVAAADFNGDGAADLAVANAESNTVTVLLAQDQVATATAAGISPVGAGTHLVDASYGGDTNYSPSTSGTVGLTAKLLPPGMTIAVSSYSVSSGTPVTFTAKVLGSTAPPKFKNGAAARPMATKPAPTGTTTFYMGTAVLGSTTLNSLGQAIFTTSTLPAGADSVTAHYSGDSFYAATTSTPVTVTVAYKPQPTVKVAPSATPISYGASVTLTATLTSSGTAKPTGTVAFLNGVTQLGTAALNASGVARYTASKLPGGEDSITAAYRGDINYGQTTSPAAVVTVNRVAPTVKLASSASSALAGTAVTLTATLSGVGVQPTGTVSFLKDGVSLGSSTVSAGGVATLVTSTIPAGRDSITATYAGDTNYTLAQSSAVTVTITPKPIPTAGLTSSATTIKYGGVVTLTATVSATGTRPTGAVNFLSGTASLGTGTLNASGVATLTTSNLPGGKDSITASYQGDARYAAATSSPVNVTVNKATPTVKLASSIASIPYGGSVTLTATLSGIGAKPTGTVTFLNGAVSLGTSTLNGSGIATLVTKKLTAGKDSVTASYAGDLDYAAGVSSAAIANVSKVTLTITANNQSKVYGAALPALTFMFSGFVNGEAAATATKGTPAPTSTAKAGSAVGSYPITVATGSLTAANYTLKLIPAELVVTKAVLTVAANNASVAYNQPLPNPTYTVTGYANGETPTVLKGDPLETTTAKKGSKAGTYPIKITQGTLVPSANYSLAFKNGTLTIP